VADTRADIERQNALEEAQEYYRGAIATYRNDPSTINALAYQRALFVYAALLESLLLPEEQQVL